MADIVLTTEGEPPTPGTGSLTIYGDSVTKKLASKDDAGTVTNYGAGGGGGAPGGADTNVQYNDAGSFGGNAALTYDASTKTLKLGLESTTTGLLAFANSASALLTTLKAGNALAAVTYTLPTGVGAAGDVLTDAAGDGVLSWAPGGGGGGSPGGLDTQVQFNDASAFGGDAAFTFDKTTGTVGVNGSANNVEVVGAATTVIPSVSGNGSDASVPLKLGYKGDQGFIQAGPDTYGVAGWAGFDLNIEVYEAATRSAESFGVYVEKYAKDEADAALSGGQFIVGTQADAVNGGATVYGYNGAAYSLAPVGITNALAYGCLFLSTQNGAGTLTDGSAFVGGVLADHGGVVTNAHGIRIQSAAELNGGSITTNYGIKIDDQTAGGTNYAIKTGLGAVDFGDNVTLPKLILPDANGAYIQTPGMAVADLPAAPVRGMRCYVTNSNAVSYTAGIGSTVAAGGSTVVPVFYDGANWLIG